MNLTGVDGCPAGWLAVLLRAGMEPEARIVPRFAGILDLAETIAVDMPIGLPERVTAETQAREREARAVIAARQSSIFAVPARATTAETEFRAACAVNRSASADGKCVSKQMFHLFPKIREIDALMTPGLAARVFETHPEVAFWRMNGRVPLATPKKIKGTPNPYGLAERIALLEAHGFTERFLTQRLGPSSVHGPDDLLDAAACAVAARRIAAGEAITFPARPMRDARGIVMAIHV